MTRKVYIREIYFYLVCLIAIILMIVGITTTLDSAINYVRPSTYTTRAMLMPVYEEQYPGLTSQEVDALIEDEMKAAVENERIFALKGLFRGGIFIIIAIPLFVIHWKMAQSIWRMVREES